MFLFFFSCAPKPHKSKHKWTAMQSRLAEHAPPPQTTPTAPANPSPPAPMNSAFQFSITNRKRNTLWKPHNTLHNKTIFKLPIFSYFIHILDLYTLVYIYKTLLFSSILHNILPRLYQQNGCIKFKTTMSFRQRNYVSMIYYLEINIYINI